MAPGSSAPSTQQRAAVLARWELAREEVARGLSQHLVVAFLGSASAGKDAAIRAVFGIDFGQIDPIPGSTETVRVAPLDADRHVLVVNAPGFGDIRGEVDAAARAVLRDVDVAVYVVNSDGGATIDERRDLDTIRALGRPVLVCLNKIDLIRPEQRPAFTHATLAQLAVSPEDAVVTAFDPLPALSEEPIGVDEVIRWIYGVLADRGKALLFAKQVRNKAAACEPIIRSAARKAAVAGSLPLPGADMAAITAIQVQMITDIAAVFSTRIDTDVVLFILGETLAGTSKGFVRWAVSALKTAGWIPGGQLAELAVSALGATIASATTYGVGRAAVAFMQRDKNLTGSQIREIFDTAAFSYKSSPDA
ncbi:MAG: GTP-binding protein Era [Myxococcota bacterium]|jgi:GTP-binding protein Era